MAEIHTSRKLRRFGQVQDCKSRALSDWHRAERRFEATEPVSAVVGENDDKADFRISPSAWLYINEANTEIIVSPDGAYALYQLLDRAFGKD